MLSGQEWCSQFPTSVSLDDLAEPFQAKAKAFIDALEAVGCKVPISATYRPSERAWLMHWCCMIAFAKQDPASVPATEGIDIQWDHGNSVDSIGAATAMAKGYGIVYPAALTSRHTQRLAIDMEIIFPEGQYALNLPHTQIVSGQPSTIYAAGASYGVIKLLSDPPHWSNDGH